jgi:hypothetical protein
MKVGDKVILFDSKGQVPNNSIVILRFIAGKKGVIEWNDEIYIVDLNRLKLLKEENMEDYLKDEKKVQAIKDSIVHWEENVEILKRGEVLSQFLYKAETCPLCKLNGWESYADGNDCRNCPLALRKMECEKHDSPWKIFRNHETVENAQNMVLALKSLFYPEEPKKKVFYSRGQEFLNPKFPDNVYMLSQVGRNNMVAMIIIRGHDKGNRWGDFIEVGTTLGITEEEFKKICGSGTFTLKEGK